jgi:flagellar biosynthesis regulator FlbT
MDKSEKEEIIQALVLMDTYLRQNKRFEALQTAEKLSYRFLKDQFKTLTPEEYMEIGKQVNNILHLISNSKALQALVEIKTLLNDVKETAYSEM